MRILAIETSCDETAVSIVDASGGAARPAFKILANITLSQAKLHAEYGGVFPMLAKREHAKNLVPVLMQALKDAKLLSLHPKKVGPFWEKGPTFLETIDTLLSREPEMLEALKRDILPLKKPKIDVIAVTHGPGLEPALWVGVNFARTLALLWNLPLVPVNHMEGHIFGSLVEGNTKKITLAKRKFPTLALLVSGGHTELLVVKNLGEYKLLGATRDDAIGEAFDKVARMLGLPYPGGPAISKIAEDAGALEATPLPRPMIKSADHDFSFAGLKTAVLYTIKKLGHEPTEDDKRRIAKGFQEAVVDVVAAKVAGATTKHKVKTIIAGGGVAANKQIRAALARFADDHKITLRVPPLHLTTDNALMIAITAYFLAIKKKFANPKTLKADGNLHLGKR